MKITSRLEDIEDLELQVSPWLEENEIPLSNYRMTSSYYKKLLHKLVCLRIDAFTPYERRDLYRRLVCPENRGLIQSDPVDFMTDNDLKEFFSPKTCRLVQKNLVQEKSTSRQGKLWVDWGCE